MANPFGAKKTGYERVLQAIGRLAERQRLRYICVLEVEGGIVLQGQALIATRGGYDLVPKTQEFSREDLEKLVSEL